MNDKQYEKEKDAEYINRSGSRNYTPAFLNKKFVNGQGWAKYIRIAVYDGNLIETGIINQEQISLGYFAGAGPSLVWPKGSGTSYGHNFAYFTAMIKKGEILWQRK